MAEPGWSRTQRRLHWWTAALVMVNAPLAFAMVAVPFSLLLTKFLAYQAHKSIGLAVVPLLVWRIALRLRRPAAEHAGIPVWQRRLAMLVHAAIYALLLIVPVLGLYTAAAAPGRIPTLFLLLIPVPHPMGPDPVLYPALRAAHRALALLLEALALGHAAMALRHHRAGRGVLRAMLGDQSSIR